MADLNGSGLDREAAGDVNLCGRCMHPAPCGCYSHEAHLGLPFPSDPAAILAAWSDHDRENHRTINEQRAALSALGAENEAMRAAIAAVEQIAAAHDEYAVRMRRLAATAHPERQVVLIDTGEMNANRAADLRRALQGLGRKENQE